MQAVAPKQGKTGEILETGKRELETERKRYRELGQPVRKPLGGEKGKALLSSS